MRRSASEIIRNLEMRIARLERQADTKLETPTLKEVIKFILSSKVKTNFGRLKWEGRENIEVDKRKHYKGEYNFRLVPENPHKSDWYDSYEAFEDKYCEPLVSDIDYPLKRQFPDLRIGGWDLYCDGRGGVNFWFNQDLLPLE